MASNLNSVYYSQSDLTSSVPLSRICADPNIDIVVLSFVTSFFSPNGYPSLNLASNCWAASAGQSAIGATGLLDCGGDGFARQISDCQAAGKKVMLSLGGYVADTSIPSEEKATELAHTLWGLFLGGKDNETLSGIRPFGADVVLDGIDIGKLRSFAYEGDTNLAQLDNENPANSIHPNACDDTSYTLRYAQ